MEDQPNSNLKLENLNKSPDKIEYTFYKKNGILHFGTVSDAADAADNEATENENNLNENKFRCNICSKYYISKDSLRSHKRNRHGASLAKGEYKKTKEHQCNFCDMKLGHVSNMCTCSVIRNPTALHCTGDSFVQLRLF